MAVEVRVNVHGAVRRSRQDSTIAETLELLSSWWDFLPSWFVVLLLA